MPRKPQKKSGRRRREPDPHFSWPLLGRKGKAPVWDGTTFRVGAAKRRVLEYGGTEAGWDQGLTVFHEEQAGASHPIDRASRALALSGLSRFLRVKRPVILEVGSSSGFMLPLLQAEFPLGLVIGSDGFSGSLHAMAPELPGVPLVQFDLCRCPFKEKSVDAVVLLNVLEHIKDDRRAIAEVFRILKPGGIAVLEVPAGAGLFDIYDEMLGHVRRYGMRELVQKAEAPGFRVLNRSHLGFFIYPPFAAVKLLNRRFGDRDARGKRERVAENISTTRDNALIDRVLRLELALGKTVSYPFGVRCILVVQKPLDAEGAGQ